MIAPQMLTGQPVKRVLRRLARTICFILATRAVAADPTAEKELQPSQLGGMELEELMKIRVTSVSRKEERIAHAAAAVVVLTQDDIRRSGFNSLPEALRMVPGMDVARLDGHDWAITSRGFNDVFANKLLVLIDGRSVYTPLFSGVFWDVQDTLLEDIDRIEVIRGPGAAVWGANAVNGVINIMTKSAKDTQGGLLMGGGGTEERVFGGARFCGKLGTNVYYRAYAKYFDRDNSVFQNGTDAYDSWYLGRTGFRVDWDATAENLVTFQGDLYGGQEHQTFNVPTFTPPFSTDIRDREHISGGNLLGRWTRTFAENSNLQLQMYYDRTDRNAAIFKEDRNTYDVDLQHRFPVGKRNDIVWGVGYRASSDKIGNTSAVSLTPDSRTVQLFNSFVQDEITLVEDKLNFEFGSKFEHNDFTGYEIQPSGRLLWRPVERHTLWGSVSRAVRTPSRAEDDIRLNEEVIPPGVPPNTSLLPALVAVLGNRQFESEKLIAYEMGYRAEPHKRCFFDLALFYNVYDDLRSLEPGTPFLEPSPTPHLVFPQIVSNGLEGQTYGGSAMVTWRPTDWWRLRPSYTFLQMEVRNKGGSQDPTSAAQAEGSSPHHQFALGSSVDVLPNVEFDSNLRFVDKLAALQTPAYWELDLRLGWRPIPKLEVALVGQNLLHDQHPEFNRTFINNPRAEVERSFYGKITWHF